MKSHFIAWKAEQPIRALLVKPSNQIALKAVREWWAELRVGRQLNFTGVRKQGLEPSPPLGLQHTALFFCHPFLPDDASTTKDHAAACYPDQYKERFYYEPSEVELSLD